MSEDNSIIKLLVCKFMMYPTFGVFSKGNVAFHKSGCDRMFLYCYRFLTSS